MAIYEHNFYIGIQDIDAQRKLTNTAILKFFEEIGCLHSNVAGYGLDNIETTHLSWVVLHWKVKILKRPNYNETITIKTWARASQKFFTYRDYEVYNSKGELLIIGSSKWTLIDIEKAGIVKITDDLITCYSPEDKFVFIEPEMDKLKEPNNTLSSFSFPVLKKDIDVNGHMHNLYYLDYGFEVVPDDVRKNIVNGTLNCFEIMYKKGAKLQDIVDCSYTAINSEHFVTMKSNKDDSLHCILKFY